MMQNFARLLERRADRNRNQVLLRHALGDRQIESRFKSEIAIREDADEFAVRVRHRHAGNLVLLHHLQRFGDRLPRTHRHWIDDHPRLGALHFVDLFRLLLDGHVLMDDAEPALLSHCDRQARLGHGVHRSGDDRNVDPDVARQPRCGVDEIRMELRFRRTKQDIIERQADLDRFGKPFRRNTLRFLDPAKIGATDDRDLIEYTFFAHGQAFRRV